MISLTSPFLLFTISIYTPSASARFSCLMQKLINHQNVFLFESEPHPSAKRERLERTCGQYKLSTKKTQIGNGSMRREGLLRLKSRLFRSINVLHRNSSNPTYLIVFNKKVTAAFVGRHPQRRSKCYDSISVLDAPGWLSALHQIHVNAFATPAGAIEDRPFRLR